MAAILSQLQCVNSSRPRIIYYICINKMDHHLLRNWLVTFSAPTHYLYLCSLNFSWTLRYTFQLTYNHKVKLKTFHSSKCIWISLLQNGCHVVPAWVFSNGIAILTISRRGGGHIKYHLRKFWYMLIPKRAGMSFTINYLMISWYQALLIKIGKL